MLLSRNSWPSIYSLSIVSATLCPFSRYCLRIGSSFFHLSWIFRGYWSFIPNVVPFSSFPRLLINSFCLKCSNFATIGLTLVLFLALMRWTWWKVMFLTVSGVSFREVCMKSVIACSGLSRDWSDIPVNIRLSRMLRHWKSSMVSFIDLFSFEVVCIWVVSELTVSLRSLFSFCRVSICNWVYSREVFRSLMSACNVSRIDSCYWSTRVHWPQ